MSANTLRFTKMITRVSYLPTVIRFPPIHVLIVILDPGLVQVRAVVCLGFLG